MTTMQAIGAFLLAIPLMTIVGLTVHALGWFGALCVWGISILLTSSLVAGIFMLGGAH